MMNQNLVEDLLEEVKNDVSKVEGLTFNELQEVAGEVSASVYMKLNDLLEGNQEAKDLLYSFDELQFVQHHIEDCEPDDIEKAKKIIRDIWS